MSLSDPYNCICRCLWWCGGSVPVRWWLSTGFSVHQDWTVWTWAVFSVGCWKVFWVGGLVYLSMILHIMFSPHDQRTIAIYSPSCSVLTSSSSSYFHKRCISSPVIIISLAVYICWISCNIRCCSVNRYFFIGGAYLETPVSVRLSSVCCPS